jgi:prophage regulatory protein
VSHWRDFLDTELRGGRFLPWKEVARTTGLSRTTAWRLQKRDDFPAPYTISPGRVGYREGEVEAWCVSRDHSAARAEPRLHELPHGRRSPPVFSEAPGGAEAVPNERVEGGPQPERPTPPSPSEPVQSASPGGKTRVRRRRSQHAQAIAQQILFDF